MTKEQIIDAVTSFYLKPGDFNGLPAADLVVMSGVDWDTLIPTIEQLIEEDLLGVLHADDDVNTHVMRVGIPPKEHQLSKLQTAQLHHTCLYPRPAHLEKVVDKSIYANQPFRLRLALGEPELRFQSFDLSVLEFYRNDPRYWYRSNDIHGFISVGEQHYNSNEMPDPDKVLLRFGFAYDSDMNRAVAVYLYDLSELSPEHQQVWQVKKLKGEYRLHPDYLKTTIIGGFGDKISIFSAFVLELYIINEMAKAMGRPSLFNKDYGEYGEDPPRKLSFLIRPTLEEFNEFVLLLDKLLSDNINKSFFQNEVPYETETERRDGKVVVQPKGTLQILDEWVKKYFTPTDWGPWNNGMAAFREVRKLRQKPAHAVNENTFDQKYFKEQRELILRAYTALRTLRMLFANAPAVAATGINVPDDLYKGNIWDF